MLCIIVSSISAGALASFGLFEDLEIYFYSFSQIVDSGLLSTLIQFYALTGKFEPVILFIFYIQSFFVTKNAFAFLLVNFSLLSYGYCLSILRMVGYRLFNRQLLWFCCGAILSYSFFSREIYILRTMYACLFLLFYLISARRSLKILFLLVGAVTHLSFVAFFALILLIDFSLKRLSWRHFSILWTCFLIFFQTLLKSTEMLAAFSSTGDMDVFNAANEGHSIQSVLLLAFTLFSLLFSFKAIRSESERTLTYFCIFLIVIGLANTENYQLMNRVAAPALCIAPFLILFKPSGKAIYILKAMYFLTTIFTARLLYLFYTGNFQIVT